MSNIKNQHILISRTDAIGDVVLTLPLCGYLKSICPDVKISFLGRTYTQPVIDACAAIDTFINYDELQTLPEPGQAAALKARHVDVIIHVYPRKEIAELAKKANIKLRIGTTNRVFHWLTCNKLVKLSRKNSLLHEAQLNIVLLQGLGINTVPDVVQLPDYYDFKTKDKLRKEFADLFDRGKFNLILHPKSHGSGREWSLQRFSELIGLLPAERFKVFISGSEKEKAILKDWIAGLPGTVVDVTGAMPLEQLVKFIAKADGLIAAGTGPLHIAAETGIHTLGLFPSIGSIHARRWGPVGKRAEFIQAPAGDLDVISAADVYNKIKVWL
ncbi:glycosyl transferase family 9 [Mucilaginibacter sp. PPCGB 2223]|uniref:glycosyltransferase family 9 protein n=1 Tax=Mucilaginibacter sp. PPCGB 2223 TaxID=1886027 RepID=UPI000824B9AD|nr:glycosyltransferase family 9 protein [Mucilaginibacter sp. PPCGB 2223]OCX51231.1 glycosyl transferase family 9 [Mucilaginibacter sp. PPCGB 2223]